MRPVIPNNGQDSLANGIFNSNPETRAMITLYGMTRSRALRSLWMLEELGVPYQREKVRPNSPEIFAVNPNGKLPALEDGGLVLFESLAINLYLAETYADASHGSLWPASPGDRARATQWSLWALGELDALLYRLLLHRMLAPEEDRDEDEARACEESLHRPFSVLETVLRDRPYLLGGEFSVADLNVASVASWAKAGRMDLGFAPKAGEWLGSCLARPAQQRAVADA